MKIETVQAMDDAENFIKAAQRRLKQLQEDHADPGMLYSRTGEMIRNLYGAVAMLRKLEKIASRGIAEAQKNGLHP